MDRRGSAASSHSTTSQKSKTSAKREERSTAPGSSRGSAPQQRPATGLPALPVSQPATQHETWPQCGRTCVWLVVLRMMQLGACIGNAYGASVDARMVAMLFRRGVALPAVTRLLIAVVVLTCLTGLLDLLWLVLLAVPRWRSGASCILGANWKHYTCEMSWDLVNAFIWLGFVVSLLVQRRWIVYALVCDGVLFIAHLTTAGINMWRRAAEARSAEVAQQQLQLQQLAAQPRVPLYVPYNKRGEAYKVPRVG